MKFKSNLNPTFRTRFAEDIFNHKYRHEGATTWRELCTTLVNDVCEDHLTRDEKSQLIQYMNDLKFIPGGRYLYYAGRDKKYFNNCGSRDTKFLTDQGIKRFDDFKDGEPVRVYSPISGEYEDATMHTHGVQPLNLITFANFHGRSSKTWQVKFTPDHRWPTRNRGVVTDLRVGDVVGSAYINTEFDSEAFLHGLVFADGNVHKLKNGFGHQLRLYGRKKNVLEDYAEVFEGCSITYPAFSKDEPVVYIHSSFNMKELPDTDDVNYIASFIKGWVLFDAHLGTVQMLHSTNRSAIDWFVDNSFLANYIVTGEVLCETSPSNFGPRKPLYKVNFKYEEEFVGFKVVNIEPFGEDIVYCPFEPKYNRIVIDYGIDTYQCFLLKCEEDTKEDWGELVRKATLCLSSGGGIGSDYSVYRQSGSIIHGSGGYASGPLSAMFMVNEIGRNVMQGGSRRSAIYASLNWKHGDIHQFLKAKDWGALVGETGLSVRELKAQDFNYAAPLDMTNISVNYDTEWLLNYWKTGDVGEVFRQNVIQALSTGEPGFSFNFFDKENETLRNACTEVTSEDDSDVCNLGSINLGRIDNINELSDITALAIKFLLCGTLKADLPYEKIYKIREKNRRLGLGLMGLHEWLIKRGMKYEVNTELHQWLSVYSGISNTISKSFADKLGVSRPAGVRAIAPTGTIGILAGTSTGIEPMFAVAYKRRYLKGTRWHYQYVVDAAAQEMIELYGTNPDAIETALDLAMDPGRRIRFQADVQRYVDMSISSTINLPKWGTDGNNMDHVENFISILASNAHLIRGFTCYPDGSRGGQPLTAVPYSEAVSKLGQEFEEGVEASDICDITGRGGSCGV